VSEQLVGDFQSSFWNAKRMMAEASEFAYRRHGVHAGQQFILRELWREDGLTPGQIARRLDLATPTVTKMANRMEAAGLVERRPHPTDRRLVRIQLTDRGRALENVIGEVMDGVTERALRTLDVDERRELVRMLDEIHRNLLEAGSSGRRLSGADRLRVPTGGAG
jgi:MarR family transcriptional regulator, organic hydroperoxide resistance regulator